MNRQALTTIVAVVAAFSVGLTWTYFTSQPAGGVAIVDLDKVAHELGRDLEMVESVKTQAGALNQTLANAQKQAVSALQNIRVGLGEEPSEEDAKKFVLAQRQAQLQLNQLKQQAEVRINQHRQQLVSKFRSEAKPIASKIAKERGLTAVVTANDTVFSFDDTVDITDEVIALMSAEAPAKTVTPASSTAPAPKPAAAPAETAPTNTAATQEPSTTK